MFVGKLSTLFTEVCFQIRFFSLLFKLITKCHRYSMSLKNIGSKLCQETSNFNFALIHFKILTRSTLFQ